MDPEDNLQKLLASFEGSCETPENFLNVQPEAASQFVSQTKQLYDFSRQSVLSELNDGALSELITENFDDEQVWQELELQNDPCVNAMLGKVSQLAASKSFSFDLVDDCDIPSARKPIAAIGASTSQGSEDEDEMEYASEDDDEEEDEDDTFEIPHTSTKEADSDEEERMLEEALDKFKPEADDDGSDDDEDDDDDDENDDDEFDLDAMKKKLGLGSYSKSKTSEKAASKSQGSKVKKRKTVVDDKFFKLADMEAFLEQEDAKEEKRQRQMKGDDVEDSDDDEGEDEDVDMFAADEESDEEEAGLTYNDFFDPPDDEADVTGDKDKDDGSEDEGSEDEEEEDEEEEGSDAAAGGGPKDLLGSSDDEGEDAADVLGHSKRELKSQFEKRQERMKQKIESIEEGMVEEKPWQLTGEVSGSKRPENSLLQEDLDFEHTTRVNPTITEETTLNLEEFIKQRVKDRAWDDVERKEKPKENPFEYKKRVVLDQEKSKLSLGEVYEQEFIKQANEEEEEEANPVHENIRKMMQSLFLKLDALSNFHFTPKPAAPEVKIVSNLPSIVMEEVAPTSVSDTAMLAPEEVQDHTRKEAKGATERDATDKKRERRDKKKRQREKHQAREKKARMIEKMNPGLGNKYAKERALKDLEKQSKRSKGVTMIKDDKSKTKDLTSSSKFFSQLQDEVKTHVKEKQQKLKNKAKSKSLSSSKLKL